MERNFYTTPKPSRLMRVFWKAAGADRYILERSTYSDQIKYTCMGGIVVATGVMAAIAGGYAFYTIFEPKGEALDKLRTSVSPDLIKDKIDMTTAIISCLFGLIWGAIIFNIDRFIVTSTGKGDGTEAITSQEIKSALPRIIMGTIIALTISKPVEIRMFKSEIDRRLQQVQDSVELVNVKLAENTFKKNTEEARANLKPMDVQIATFQKRWVFLDSMVTYENTHGGCHGKCEENKRERIDVINRINEIKKSDDYVRNKSIIEKYNEEFDKTKAKAKTDKLALDGLLLRIQLANEVSGFWISFFITLLFLAIELTPIFFKLMLIKGPYDYIEENIKELIKAENGIQIQYNYYKDKQGQERDLVVHHQVEKQIMDKIKILEAQKELSQIAIEKWKDQQKTKMNNNLNDFIKEG